MSKHHNDTPDCAGRNGAHTPWTVVSDPSHYDSKTDVVDARGDLVACTAGSDVATMEANARLIAAAPELLEALKRLRAASTSIRDDIEPETVAALAEADAAIAKAEGRS